MPRIDFIESATRHLRDASLLFEQGRYDNAFYLSGYAVECSLKAVTGWAGLSAQIFGHKLAKLGGDGLDLAMAIAPAAARYRPLLAAVHLVNSSWSTDCRYYQNSITQKLSKSVLLEAEKVWQSCIGEMFLDGLIQELP